MPRSQFRRVLLATLLLWAASSAGFWHLESPQSPELTVLDAVWWSIVTMTTVGYGDLYPTTTLGRFAVAIPTMLLGIGLLGYALSTMATSIIDFHSRRRRGMVNVHPRDHVLIIHFPSTAYVTDIVRELRGDPKTAERDIVVIDDHIDELPQELRDLDVLFVKGNPTKDRTLERANVDAATYAVVLARKPLSPSSDNDTLAASLVLERTRPEIITVAECVDVDSIDLLKKSGCDSVVCLNAFRTSILAQEMIDPGSQAVLRELSTRSVGQKIYFVDISHGNKTFEDVHNAIAAQGGLTLGLERGGKRHINPGSRFPIEQGDRAICVANTRPRAIS